MNQYQMERVTLRPVDVAEYTGIGICKVRQLIKQGEIPSLKLFGGKKFLVPKRLLDEWLESEASKHTKNK